MLWSDRICKIEVAKNPESSRKPHNFGSVQAYCFSSLAVQLVPFVFVSKSSSVCIFTVVSTQVMQCLCGLWHKTTLKCTVRQCVVHSS